MTGRVARGAYRDALVEHAADEIESILRRHLGAPAGPAGTKGKLALERLLDELEATQTAAPPAPDTH